MNGTNPLGRLTAILVFFTVNLTLFAGSTSVAIPVTVGSAPENDLSLILNGIKSAKKSLLINTYELTSEVIADALAERIDSGLKVQILIEGQPVGGFSKKSKGVQDDLVQHLGGRRANVESQFFVMENDDKEAPTRKQGRRYNFDHAKYMVVDGKSLVVGSENYSATGNPSPGKKGNRGWEVFIDDGKIAKQFETFFSKDSDMSFGDVTALIQHKIFDSLFEFEPLTTLASSLLLEPSRPIAGPMPAQTEAADIQVFASPDTSLDGLNDFMNSANKTLDVELLSFNSRWEKATVTSPLIQTIEAVAKKGVRVRVLLNDERAFSHSQSGDNEQSEEDSFADASTTNIRTRDLLNDIASEQGLPIEARTANLKAMGVTYIHNKGALVDGKQVLISSINWNQNSVKHNRETAVVLHGDEAAAYYSRLFESDWKKSE